MNVKDSFLAVMRGSEVKSLPVVSFFIWQQTLEKWNREGYLRKEDFENAEFTKWKYRVNLELIHQTEILQKYITHNEGEYL